MSIQLIFVGFLSFAIALLVIPYLRKVASFVHLIDRPGLRKIHHVPVPLVGGIGIFFASFLSALLSIEQTQITLEFKNVFIASFILMIMGVIDDRYDIKATLKFVIQLLLAHFVFESGIKIESLFGLFGLYELSPFWQYLITIITIAGVVNAINLMDGIDGLAGSLALLGFSFFGILSFLTGQVVLSQVFVALFGSTLAFLYFNLGTSKKIFMGDAGSLLIGFILAVSGIKMLQTQETNPQGDYVFLGVIFILIFPVFDALRVFRKRLKAGHSPFKADKTHFHHLLLSANLNPNKATVVMSILMLLIVLMGSLLYDFVGVTMALILVLLFLVLCSSFLQLNGKIMFWKAKIKAMEKGRA